LDLTYFQYYVILKPCHKGWQDKGQDMTTEIKTETETETETCTLCGSASSRYFGKHLVCFICYADLVE